MSDFLVHFVTPRQGTAYDVVMSILWDQTLRAINPFGIARRTAPDPTTQRTACLSEVPLHHLSRLAQRRSSYGLGFSKQFILGRGGGPVWYVETGSPSHMAIQAIITQALAADDSASQPVWSITPFIDTPGDFPGGNYRFEWERERRHVGDLHFDTHDVELLIVPAHLHGAAAGFFYGVWEESSGPAYFCPIIDPDWSIDQVTEVFATHDYSWMRGR